MVRLVAQLRLIGALGRRVVLEDLASDVVGSGILNPRRTIGSLPLSGAVEYLD